MNKRLLQESNNSTSKIVLIKKWKKLENDQNIDSEKDER